jgi:hypothetical protein
MFLLQVTRRSGVTTHPASTETDAVAIGELRSALLRFPALLQ